MLKTKSQSKLLSFIEKDYNVLDFIHDVWDWQESHHLACIQYLENVPDEFLEEYTKEGLIYRGMVVDFNNVYNLDLCSWTTDLSYAVHFSERDVYFDEVMSVSDEAHSVVYKKVGSYLDLSAIIRDLENWMVDNEDYIVLQMDKTVDELFDRFYSEGEVLSDFHVSDVEIHFQEMVSIAC